ncbi:MAG: polysaccharide export protein [Oculatellaceae cyanobacterium Prado106]|jgi:polysaccharide export outer membrane protein|nr:polysaccharide export protein [Oculatellaceae cyanobacterium Prado106]
MLHLHPLSALSLTGTLILWSSAPFFAAIATAQSLPSLPPDSEPLPLPQNAQPSPASPLFQFAQPSPSLFSPPPAAAPTEPPAQPSAPANRNRLLLEQARQRLIQQNEPLPSESTPSAASFDTYRLGPGDSIYVNVLRFPDLSFQGTIDQQGNLVVPLMGAIALQGFTVEQTREQIRRGLDRFVVNPQVDVILIAQRPVQVTILGEVFKPGFYPLQAPQLTSALTAAGGTTSMADLRTVRIRRPLDDGTVLEQDFDLFNPLRESMSLPDIRLADGDTIIIPTLTAENSEGYDRNLIARSTIAQPQINIRIFNRGTASGGTIGRTVLPNGSTFVDALAAISPDLSSANIREIALIRYDVQQGKAVKIELNGKKALMGDMSQNPLLEHNDVIVVGRNLIARITHALNTFTQPFRDVLGFLLFFDSLTESADNLFQPSSRR